MLFNKFYKIDRIMSSIYYIFNFLNRNKFSTISAIFNFTTRNHWNILQSSYQHRRATSYNCSRERIRNWNQKWYVGLATFRTEVLQSVKFIADTKLLNYSQVAFVMWDWLEQFMLIYRQLME